MAYAIVERLKEHNNIDILKELSEAVTPSEKNKRKLHHIFECSFDCKEISSHHFFMQKLSYTHNNPCSGIWKLVENPVNYIHSSEETRLWISTFGSLGGFY